MVRFVRGSTIKPGNYVRAFAFSKDISAYVESVTGVPVNVFLQTGGKLGRICWQADYPDMAALEKAMEQLLSDSGYLKKVESAADFFIEGQARDSIWIQQ